MFHVKHSAVLTYDPFLFKNVRQCSPFAFTNQIGHRTQMFHVKHSENP